MTRDAVERAWELLRTHVGHANPITSAELARVLGTGDEHRGTAETRAIITEVIRRGLPVGATESGYFVLANAIERDRYVRELEDRASAIIYRGKLVQRAFETYYEGDAQRTLVRWNPDPEERV